MTLRSRIGPATSDAETGASPANGSGSDAVVALALGARAVAIGRPYAYALALAGEDGVRELLRNTVAELDITLGLAGVRSAAELDASILETAPQTLHAR